MNEREPQPFTAEDLKLGEKIVMELHGIDGFAGWSEYIAKAIAALRSPPLAAGSEAVAWQKQFIAYLAETVDMMSATPRQREVYKASLKYAISHAVRKTAVAHPPSPSPDGTKAEPDSKLVYVKRWRTLVRLPIKYADEIVEALRAPAEPSPDGRAEVVDALDGLLAWVGATRLGITDASERMAFEDDFSIARKVSAAIAAGGGAGTDVTERNL